MPRFLAAYARLELVLAVVFGGVAVGLAIAGDSEAAAAVGLGAMFALAFWAVARLGSRAER